MKQVTLGSAYHNNWGDGFGDCFEGSWGRNYSKGDGFGNLSGNGNGLGDMFGNGKGNGQHEIFEVMK